MAWLKPPLCESRIGMQQYLSSTNGCGGRIKQEPEDFIVREICEDGFVCDIESDTEGDMLLGEYVHFTLVKRNWETMRAVKEVSKRLGVSRNRMGYAGTKDKRAITAQRLSVNGLRADVIRDLRIGDIRIKDIGYADQGIGLGCLWGNEFNIRVREIEEDNISETSQILCGVFPNYFGMQRFGQIRPVTHIVGLNILRGDIEGAVMEYLCHVDPAEGEDATSARKMLYEGGDFQKAVAEYPRRLGYEAAMLNHLVKEPGDFSGAIQTLPKGLQTMFIHAYQAFVFNKALSCCIRDGAQTDVLPLVGYGFEPDSYSEQVLKEDDVLAKDFGGVSIRGLKSEGSQRQAFALAQKLDIKVVGGDAYFSFRLKKGSYATSLIREYTKN